MVDFWCSFFLLSFNTSCWCNLQTKPCFNTNHVFWICQLPSHCHQHCLWQYLQWYQGWDPCRCDTTHEADFCECFIFIFNAFILSNKMIEKKISWLKGLACSWPSFSNRPSNLYTAVWNSNLNTRHLVIFWNLSSWLWTPSRSMTAGNVRYNWLPHHWCRHPLWDCQHHQHPHDQYQHHQSQQHWSWPHITSNPQLSQKLKLGPPLGDHWITWTSIATRESHLCRSQPNTKGEGKGARMTSLLRPKGWGYQFWVLGNIIHWHVSGVSRGRSNVRSSWSWCGHVLGVGWWR